MLIFINKTQLIQQNEAAQTKTQENCVSCMQKSKAFLARLLVSFFASKKRGEIT
jgi:hypothetical protein